MKIIALEEHTVDRAIGAATTQVANENVPYLKAFYRDDLMATPSAKQLFEMGETRLKDMDRCGIDVEVISHGHDLLSWRNPSLHGQQPEHHGQRTSRCSRLCL